MKSSEVRQMFFEFFESKSHKIVPSAPIVIKNDPTLMFTNAGMNQFKDYFLGNKIPPDARIADTQKCLRVSGKHNDLEEVGHDTYHHTMFEMLGNWSFGDYFKKEAIEWAWELLTEIYQIDKDRLYITVFGGDIDENLQPDNEAYNYWQSIVDKDKIIKGNKKDNFWEMGETGPCGPCSEIHIDLRNESERKKIPAADLINKDNPLVIEIWNLVFIQFNRLSDGKLINLTSVHVDTGMGLERLCMILQGKTSNYDTDIFQPLIQEISEISGIGYGKEEKSDIAMRVIADHIRAIAFSIADGQLPSNNKAGYVIRRILRRAVRYGYTYLNLKKEPFIYRLVPVLSSLLSVVFPELKAQQHLIEKVVAEEEEAFLKTLDNGIKLLDNVIEKTISENQVTISGKVAFLLYDTYGFPFDLTTLILKENNLTLDKNEFDEEMKLQKNRSRSDIQFETDDWNILIPGNEQEFIGYDYQDADVKITRFRKIKIKDRIYYQLVFNYTPFYAESGGQMGDTGFIENENEKIFIIDTKKENDLIIHITGKLPKIPSADFRAVVDSERRLSIARNHSATHLLHFTLRNILGKHVEQKGSLVHPDYFRFDFSHFQKLSAEEIRIIENSVNSKIIENISLDEKRDVPFKQAKEIGAIALFGEKYGEKVRVIQFDKSVELCGGTHVHSTGNIGTFIIINETSIAAGIRRIEAVTGKKAIEYLQRQSALISELSTLLNVNSEALPMTIENILAKNKILKKELESFQKEKLSTLKNELIKKAITYHGKIKVIVEKIELDSVESGKDLIFDINRIIDNVIILLGSAIAGKAYLWLMMSENIAKEKNLNAVDIICEISAVIQGGGGGQVFFATAGGTGITNISGALEKGKIIIVSKI